MPWLKPGPPLYDFLGEEELSDGLKCRRRGKSALMSSATVFIVSAPAGSHHQDGDEEAKALPHTT